jgi:hypothetical protein
VPGLPGYPDTTGQLNEVLTVTSDGGAPTWEAPAPQGADLVYNGAYPANTPYTDGDIVVANGVAYMCVRPTAAAPTPWPGGGGQPPDLIKYLGDYSAATTYYDGDVVIGSDGFSYMCCKDGTVGVAPVPFPGSNGGIPLPVQNGKWIKGVGGAAVWSSITPADVGTVKVTTSALSGGPPASPADTDVWIATAVDASGARWSFQYNAGSASAYKWEFIGGAPVSVFVAASEFRVTGGYGDLATVGPRFQILRAGAYEMYGYVTVNKGNNTAAFTGLIQILMETSGATGVIASVSGIGNTTGSTTVRTVLEAIGSTPVAGEFVKLVYAANITTADLAFSDRRLVIRPIRIS